MAYVATAGWRGVIELTGSSVPPPKKLRFTSEAVVVNQGLEIANDVHVGQRTAGVFEYRHIIPEGDISFPMITKKLTMGSAPVEPVCAYLMKQAIVPYSGTDLDPPILGETMVIRRGDAKKTIYSPHASSISVSGTSGARVDVTITAVARYGEYSTDENPEGFPDIVRAVFFNELDWAGANFSKVLYLGSTTEVVPRNFNFTSNTNLIRDDSYYASEPQSLRGFVLGRQDVTCNITVIGAADPERGGVGGNDPVETDVSIGGIYNVLFGLWTAKVINVAGPADLNVSEITLSGMGQGMFSVTPGPILGA
ncbi:MAG: hypothetical protein QXX57_05420 [Nitrososphaerota archaeon]